MVCQIPKLDDNLERQIKKQNGTKQRIVKQNTAKQGGILLTLSGVEGLFTFYLLFKIVVI